MYARRARRSPRAASILFPRTPACEGANSHKPLCCEGRRRRLAGSIEARARFVRRCRGFRPFWTIEAGTIRDASERGEEEPHAQGRLTGEGCSGDPAKDAPTVFGRRKDSDRLEGLRGEESIATLCRREGLAPSSDGPVGVPHHGGREHSRCAALRRWAAKGEGIESKLSHIIGGEVKCSLATRLR